MSDCIGESYASDDADKTIPNEFNFVREMDNWSIMKAMTAIEQHNVASVISVALTRKSLPRLDRIINDSRSVDECDDFSGVYLLIDSSESKVVYVGQSTNVMSRIKSHLRERSQENHPSKKTFDRYAWIPCRNQDLDVLESLFIHSHQPKYNSAPPRISFDYIFQAAAEKYEREKTISPKDFFTSVFDLLQHREAWAKLQ